MARWDKPGIPHKGWSYVGVEDLGDDALLGEEIPYEECEMCGNEKIRYVHILTHPEFVGEIRVGCSFAEKMVEDNVDPERKEKELRNRTNRRKNFLRQVWIQTNKGFILIYKGYIIKIVKSRYATWGVEFLGRWCWNYRGKQMYDLDTAKLAAFDIFDTLNEWWPQFQPH